MYKENRIGQHYILRRLQAEDVKIVIDLYNLSIAPLWKKYGRDFDLCRIEKNIVNNLQNPVYFMYILFEKKTDSSPKPAGYLAWEKHLDHTSNHIIAHLRMVFTHPDIRRSGIGNSLIMYFEKSAKEKGCTKILFDVLVNSPANKFYNNLGYQQWSNYMEKYL